MSEEKALGVVEEFPSPHGNSRCRADPPWRAASTADARLATNTASELDALLISF